MIFVTVGGQLPFPRLVGAMDRWAELRGRGDVLAQIGEGSDPPKHLEWVRFMTPRDFASAVERADAIVAHAGMGTILTGLTQRKPILVVPRQAELGEHRNDHQVETARRLAARGLVLAAYTEAELFELADRIEAHPAAEQISAVAQPELIGRVRAYARDRGAAGH